MLVNRNKTTAGEWYIWAACLRGALRSTSCLLEWLGLETFLLVWPGLDHVALLPQAKDVVLQLQ